MLRTVLILVPLVPAAVMAVSDFRHRTVSVGWMTVFGISCLFSSLFLHRPVLTNLSVNVCLLGCLFGGTLFYLGGRYGYWGGPLGKYMGIGDWLFLLCLTPVFGWKEFLNYLIVTFLLTLIGWTLYAVSFEVKGGVPLVGALGCVLIVYSFFTL